MIELDVSLLVVMLVESKGRCCDELYEIAREEVWCLTCCTGAAVLSRNRVAHCGCMWLYVVVCDCRYMCVLIPFGKWLGGGVSRIGELIELWCRNCDDDDDPEQ